MLKVIGCLLIGAASVGLAISFGVELREHLTLLYDLRQLLVDISQEAQYSLLPMERILGTRIRSNDPRLTGRGEQPSGGRFLTGNGKGWD